MPDDLPPTDAAPPTSGEPPQNSKLARQHLVRVGRQGQNRFRLIMDDPKRKKNPKWAPIDLVGTLDEHAQALRRYNDAGYGVFFMANRAEGGQKAENVVAANAFFADFDGTPLENVARLRLTPHVEVETSPGKRHYYWRVEGIPIDAWQGVQQRLIALFGSDKSIHDRPRVMRLAGFLHQKNPTAPSLVNIVAASDAAPYTHAAFMEALDAAEKALGLGAYAPKRKLPAAIAPPADRDTAADIARAESALRHQIGLKLLDLGDRGEWVRVGLALKASYGDDGFDLWLGLSSEADGYEGEEDCRREWATFKDDRPPEKRITIATFISMAKANGWKGGGEAGHGDGGDADGEGGGGRGRGKPDAASVVLEQANEAGDERFLDKDGTPHVRFRRKAGDGDSPWVTARLDSDLYQGVLRRRFHLEAGNKTLPKEQLSSALALLRAEAIEQNVRRAVHLRVGAHGGKIYVDVSGDGTLVYEVDGDGWRPAAVPPVLFVAGSRAALPVPVQGGTLADLMAHMPSLDREAVQRGLAFVIGTFNPNGTCPMLLLGGGHGSNKSTTADMLVAISDPPAARQDARYTFSADDRDLVIHAQHAHLLYFDNVSGFGPRESDSLCKLMSGTAFATRMLHTNSEEQRFAMRRPVIATCIGTPTTRGDLLDRTIPIMAEPKPGKRKTEAAVWAAFDKDWPRLFGLVLTGVSQALRNAAKVQAMVEAGAIDPPRLMDFAQFVEGAHQALELEPGAFCKMLRKEQAALQAEAAAGDPLGAALQEHFSVQGAKPIVATAAELLKMLSNGVRERERGWPSKFKVSSHLERIKPGLADNGIAVKAEKIDKRANVMVFTIETTAGFKPVRLADSEHF